MGDYCFCDNALLRRHDAYFMWVIIAQAPKRRNNVVFKRCYFWAKIEKEEITLLFIRERKNDIALCHKLVAKSYAIN